MSDEYDDIFEEQDDATELAEDEKEGLIPSYISTRGELNQGVVFKTLKRKRQSFRFVPLPSQFLEKLDDVHHVKDFIKNNPDELVWSFNRKTGWAAIKAVMDKACIDGAQATAHGLRHSFVIAHQQIKTPPHMIQEWAGWASTQMLGVYGRAFGEEERALASQIW